MQGGKCGTGKCGTKMQGWKMQDWKMRHQNAGVENAAPTKYVKLHSAIKCMHESWQWTL